MAADDIIMEKTEAGHQWPLYSEHELEFTFAKKVTRKLRANCCINCTTLNNFKSHIHNVLELACAVRLCQVCVFIDGFGVVGEYRIEIEIVISKHHFSDAVLDFSTWRKV